MFIIIWSLTIIAAILLYFNKIYSRFKDAGVNYFRPIPPFGNIMKSTFRKEHMFTTGTKIYHAFPGDRFLGHFEFLNPIVVIKDLDLIKQIAVKDFDYFTDHRSLGDGTADPIFSRNLFSMKGNDWRNMRSTLSPAFTSSKIKLMVPFMTEVGDRMINVLKEKINNSKAGFIDVELQDLTTRYANDVIATCAYGIKVDSHTNDENEFYKKGRQITNFNISMMLKFFGYTLMPKVMNFLKIPIFPKSTTDFFKVLVRKVMKDREDNNIIRPDMIHLLMQAKKGQLIYDEKSTSVQDTGFATVEESAVGRKTPKSVWTEDDLVAQALIFFFAGFETVSSVMTFMLYELGTHPDVQEKLYQEIKELDEKNGGKLDFDSIQQMNYMDMVVSETLRLWTPLAFTDRICIADYNLGRANKDATKDYIIKKGEAIFIPIWPLQQDPKYWDNPKAFDPERFSEENRDNIKPFTYVPFGLGPRNCIGSRFALCEVKVIAYQLLKELEISPCEKTTIPAALRNDSFQLRMEGGAWLRFKTR